MNKPKLNQPDVEITTTTNGESITINKTIPSKQFKDIFVTDTPVERYNPTLEEVKQKWEELGYELIRHERRELIFKHKEDGAIFTMWNFNSISYSKYWRGKPAIITFQEHLLLTKTFRALGWFDE